MDPTVAKIIQDVLVSVEPAVVSVVAGVIAILALKCKTYIENHMSDKDYEMAKEMVKTVVLFVEQTSVGQDGLAKKNEAMKVIDQRLKDYGLPYTAEELTHEIEAAVYQFTTKDSAPAPVVVTPAVSTPNSV